MEHTVAWRNQPDVFASEAVCKCIWSYACVCMPDGCKHEVRCPPDIRAFRSLAHWLQGHKPLWVSLPREGPMQAISTSNNSKPEFLWQMSRCLKRSFQVNEQLLKSMLVTCVTNEFSINPRSLETFFKPWNLFEVLNDLEYPRGCENRVKMYVSCPNTDYTWHAPGQCTIWKKSHPQNSILKSKQYHTIKA